MLSEYLLAEGREGERGAGRKGRRKEGREEGGKKEKKEEREGGQEQLLTLHLLLCSRVELVCFTSVPSTTVTSIVQSYGPFRNQNVLACFHMIEKQILTFFNL